MFRNASRHRIIQVAACVLFALAVGASASAQQPNSKLPIPDEAARKEAETLIREVFARDLAATKTSDEQITFAKLLIKQSQDLKDNAAEYYVLLGIAREVAAQAGSVELALDAVKRLDAHFTIDAAAMQIETVRAVGKESRSPSQFRSLAQNTIPLIDAAAISDQYEAASQLGTLAVAAARRARDYDLLRRITDRLKVVDQQGKLFTEFEQTVTALQSNPDNPKLNGVAGRFLCLLKGDWQRGLPLLAKSDDAALKAIAKRDLEGASTAAEKIAVGDAWWELAESSDAELCDAAKLRAGAWYKAAQPQVTGGLNRLKLNKRLPAIALLGRPIPRIEPPPSKPPVTDPVPVEPHPPVSPPPVTDTVVRVSGVLSKTLTGHAGAVKSVAFSPDGKTLASTSADGTIRIWDIPSGNQARVIQRGGLDWNNVAFSPDGKLLASTGGRNDHNVRIWQAASGQLLRTLAQDELWLKALAFSPDGTTLVAAGESGKVTVWDPSNGQTRTRLAGHTLWVFSAQFSPDGRQLATAGSDRTIRIWDARTFRQVKAIIAHKDRIWSLAYSPDGRLLASSSADKTIKLWNTASGRKLKTIVDQQAWIRGVAISPDGKLLASAGHDSTVRLWDLPTGKPHATLKGHTNKQIECVAFSPDGKLLASCGSDKTVRLWQIIRTAASQD